jgi:hypothetical protein
MEELNVAGWLLIGICIAGTWVARLLLHETNTRSDAETPRNPERSSARRQDGWRETLSS